MNLGKMLAESGWKYPENIALIFRERKLTYGELNKEVNRLAHGLIRLGIKPGDRVAILLGNSPEFVIGYFAILKSGASVVPLNNTFKEGELKYILGDSQSRLVLTSSPFRETLNKVSGELLHLKHKVIFDGRWLLKRALA